MPYIVKWANETNITDPEFSNSEISGHAPKTIESTDGKVSFVGIYDPVTLTANDNTVLYLGAGNQLYYPSAAMSINAFRAYFQLDGITAGEPKNIRLFFGGADKDTGIRPLSGSPEGEGAEAFPREGSWQSQAAEPSVDGV